MNYNIVILCMNSIRSALQALKNHLKPIQFKAEEALRYKYYKLYKLSVKKIIEDWLLKQITLKNNIAYLDIIDILDTMLAYGFLKGAEKQAPAIAKIQSIYKQDFKEKLNFQNTLYKFHYSYSLKLAPISFSAFIATL